MQTDHLKLLEFISDKVLLQSLDRSVARPLAYGDETESFFETPSPELAAPAVTLAALLDGEPDLIRAAIARWRKAGHSETTVSALQAIAVVLDRRGDPQARSRGARTERVRDFVYPVF